MRRSILLLCATFGLLTITPRAATITDGVREAANSGRAVWIFFRDKGPSSVTADLAHRQWVSDRALARIARRGSSHNPEDYWPVYKTYKRQLAAAGMTIRSESRWLNAIAGIVPPEKLRAVADLACVTSLQPVVVYHRPLPEVSKTPPPQPKTSGGSEPATYDYGASAAQIVAIQADQLHNAGFDGRGVMVGFLDTGFDVNREVFASLHLVATYDFINGDADVGDDDLTQMSHGTATLSVCGGFLPGELIGVAPGAEYALAKTEVRGSETEIEEDYWVEGLEWIDSLGCDVASSSLGYNAWYTYSQMDGNTAVTTIAADRAAAHGLLVVNSAGNEANNTWHYIIAPADGDSVLAVGATTLEGDRVSFSSVGPTADGRIKPDVMAPGSNVWGADPGYDTFSGKSGTSFSAPLVSGVCALILQMQPDLTPYQLISLLRNTATNSAEPDNQMGWGIVQAAVAAGLDIQNENGTHVELWPNPMNDLVRIVLPESDPEGESRVWIYTASGQLVHRQSFTGHSAFWRGRNDDGDQVASGVYLVLVRTPVREETVKLAVLWP